MVLYNFSVFLVSDDDVRSTFTAQYSLKSLDAAKRLSEEICVVGVQSQKPDGTYVFYPPHQIRKVQFTQA